MYLSDAGLVDREHYKISIRRSRFLNSRIYLQTAHTHMLSSYIAF